MYLHGFSNPKIYEYDTLSRDDKWDEKAEVILANPPFMSPKGGIKPHSRFSVPSNRSEVLFVDYMAEHLTSQGRAAIIVPEGVVFQTGSAYKQLRKMLVEEYLVGVISLPAGIFNPYSGVKTSILWLDKQLAKKTDSVLFVKIENDGYDLGAQRKPKRENDLPDAYRAIMQYKEALRVEKEFKEESWQRIRIVPKSKIAKDGDCSLSSDRYVVAKVFANAKWPIVEIGDLITTITPPQKILKEHYGKMGSFPIIDQSQEEISGWTNDENSLVKSEKPLVIFGDHTCAVKYTEKSFAQGADGIKILLTNDRLAPKFLYYILKTRPIETEGYQRHFAKLKRFKIPLPPVSVQEEVVAELDGYQKIISGARQIVENYTPQVDIDSNWPLVEIGKLCELATGGTPRSNVKEYYVNGTIKWLVSGDIHKEEIYECDGRITELGMKESNAKILPINSVLIALNGQGKTRGTVALLRTEATCNQSLVAICPIENTKLMPEYLFLVLKSKYQEIRDITGDNQRSGLNMPIIRNIKISLPPIEVQKRIVSTFEEEYLIIKQTVKLIEKFEIKTEGRIAKVWGEK
jgi:type I restriction enzyme M protein